MSTSTKTRKRVKKSATKKPKIKTQFGPGEVPPESQQRMIRTSERSTYQTCLHQWDWSYLHRRKPIIEGPALRFGTLIHLALEARYPKGVRRGPHPRPLFEELYEKATKEAYSFGFRDEDGKWNDAGEIGVDMLNGFVDKYGKDEEWKVIASEQTFQIPVFDPETNMYVFTYVGTIDGVWENRMDGAIRIIDWKTTAKDPELEAKNPGYNGALSLQGGAYWTYGVDHLVANNILKPAMMQHLDGMVFSYLRKAKDDPRPRNKDGQCLNQDGTVSKKQPPANFHREVIYRSEGDRERYRARSIIQVKKMIELQNGPAERREKQPHWINCNMCSFKDACELHEIEPQGGFDFLNGSTVEWNPYDAHEIEQEGK